MALRIDHRFTPKMPAPPRSPTLDYLDPPGVWFTLLPWPLVYTWAPVVSSEAGGVGNSPQRRDVGSQLSPERFLAREKEAQLLAGVS